MSAFLDETGTLITVSEVNPLPVTIVTTDYTEAELPDAASVPSGTEVFNTTYQVKMRSNGTSWEWLGIGTATLSALPLPTAVPSGTKFNITGLGTGSAVFMSNGTYWLPVGEVLLKTVNTDSVVANFTDETTLATFTMPKKLASPNMTIVVNAAWTTNATAGVKNTRIRFGGDIVSNPTHNGASLISMQYEVLIRFRNSLSNQFAYGVTVPGSYTPTSAASVFLTKDMSEATGSDVDIVLTGQVPVVNDNITLRGYTITLRG